MKHSKGIVGDFDAFIEDKIVRLLPTTFKVPIHKSLISVLVIPNKKHFVTIMGSQTTSRGNVHAHKDMQHIN
jgi:hypothetical protein